MCCKSTLICEESRLQSCDVFGNSSPFLFFKTTLFQLLFFTFFFRFF